MLLFVVLENLRKKKLWDSFNF